MIIKIYPDLRWEITDLKWIDPPTSYSLEYDVVREFDDINYTDRSSNVIFLINKSREISPVLAKALGKKIIKPNINWFMVDTRWYWRWVGKCDTKINYLNNRELVIKTKCPIPQEDIERCIVSAERVNKIDQLLNKKYED